jgi:hypothetical protein
MYSNRINIIQILRWNSTRQFPRLPKIDLPAVRTQEKRQRLLKNGFGHVLMFKMNRDGCLWRRLASLHGKNRLPLSFATKLRLSHNSVMWAPISVQLRRLEFNGTQY